MKTDPRHLLQLSMIIESGSFQAAADRLGMTQPALSRNIRLLESRIGAPVFDRSSRRAIPTALGMKLAQHGLSIRIAEEQASAYSQLASVGSAGELRVGAPPIVAGRFLTGRLSRFVVENPNVHVEMRTGLVHELRSMLERGQIDLVVGPRNLADGVETLRFELLVEDRIGIMCRAEHPLLRLVRVESADLERQVWVAHSRGSMLRQQTEGALVAMGIATQRIGVETSSIRSVMEIVAATDLITTMPRESSAPYLRDELAFLDVDHPQFARPIGMITRRDQPANSVIDRFATQMRRG